MASSKKTTSAKYSLNAKGAFNIVDYNHSKIFSNFFPGVAGVWGIPMWVFYVNRGQCITSFGIEDKDKAILEFQPANKAYRQSSLQGFRTFIKIHAGKKSIYWEPFQKNLLGTEFKKDQLLSVTPHDLTLEETNHDLGIKVTVKYFTMPEEPFSALVREVTVKNLKKTTQRLELLDGLPLINCYGLKDWLTKNMARTAEAWISVGQVKEKTPFYQLTVEIADKPEVTHIKEGNFFFSLDAGSKLIDPIIETDAVFGQATDYSAPERFLNGSFKIPKEQRTSNKTPCAFGYQDLALKANQETTFVSLYGYAHDLAELEKTVAKAKQKGFIKEKEAVNKRIIDEIRNYTFTNSASEAFNLYAGHTFLDNVLRGGLPVSLKTEEGNVAFNVYSRKHGDPERDYNYFNLSPTYYSQGNGNYRDVNQNRRNDVWFNTDVRDEHLKTFLNLVQADGYNPLVVKGATFTVAEKDKLKGILKDCCASYSELNGFLDAAFRPGDLLTALAHKNIALKVDKKDFLSRVLEICHKHESAEHGEGFWSDHWTYNQDLVESYLSLFPDHLKNLLLDQKDFSFYHNDHYVLPRDQRYILKAHGVRQYASVAHPPKDAQHKKKSHLLRTKQGAGPVYKTNLLVKLLCLVANKIATLDPSGKGVEMEADKPNWYDALNGLPGLLGSSLSETIEIKRFSQFLLEAINKTRLGDEEKISIFEEAATFIAGLENLLTTQTDPLWYWKKANDIKEHYRQRIRNGIEGAETQMAVKEIKDFLSQAIKRVDKALAASKDAKGFLATYFYHEVTGYDKLDKASTDEKVYVRPKTFKCHVLPPFLEGYVHALRATTDVNEARELYKRIRESDLFDKSLKMYKVNTGLSSQTEEIGRSRIFPKGWLENESIWLHMEYKLMLELLRCDLYTEYYENFKNVLIPFQKPATYGRSILENSSFIVSSAHEDPGLHGQGFVARLSGSTAEFLHMWLFMNAGKKPFAVNANGLLQLSFEPILEGSLFTTKKTSAAFCSRDGHWQTVEFPKDSYAFNWLGGTLVVYHNPKRRNTFGANKARIKNIKLTYPNQKPVEIKTPVIPSPYAEDIRSRRVERIDVAFE